MQALVFEKLLVQLAKEKNALPSDADINNYIPFAKKYQQNPQLTLLSPDPSRTDTTWRHDVRLALMRRNLAMAPLKITEDDIKKEYETVKGKITPPDQYHLRMIDVKTNDKALKALESLKTAVALQTELDRGSKAHLLRHLQTLAEQSDTTDRELPKVSMGFRRKPVR